MAASSSSLPPPGISEASRISTEHWQRDLLELFRTSKDRFPDVVWEMRADEDDDACEEVWGHKAIVYARAPPSFQARYFSFRPAPISSPTPYAPSPSPAPAGSTASLNITVDCAHNSRSPSPSPFRSSSPSPSLTNGGPILHIPTTGNPALFSNELEYLYTGAGLGEAFEFLFDTSESRDLLSNEENRLDKLRKDLVYMWRSRLYSDIRVSLSGTFSTSNPEHTTAVFSTHRFILASRSPYFKAQLLPWGQLQSAKTSTSANTSTPGEPLTINLPSPPFTPASLHFTLGYIYTGTLHFSHRTFDLDTAFAILRASLYLSLPALTSEIQARIVYEMLHGLFHAFLEFNAYESITGAKWGTGGCRCRQCARRVPRALEFAVADDVQNKYLERGARRALVGLFGEGWCTSEFAVLPQKTRDSVLKGLAKRTTPANVFPLLFAAQHALRKLDSAIDAWADIVREMVSSARKSIDECLVRESDACFEDHEWVTLLEGDGVAFGDTERVGWVMESLKRGMSEKHAGVVYQTIVSSILLRPHPTSPTTTLLPSTSPIRSHVEDARVDLLKYIRKRWMGIRGEGGFDGLESWSLKEVSQEIEIAVEDLLSPPTHAQGGSLRSHHSMHLSRALRPSLIRNGDADSDTLSVHSLRASVLSKSVGGSGRDGLSSGASSRTLRGDTASIRSVSRNTGPSVRTRNQSTPLSGGTLTRANVAAHIRAQLDVDAERPDSKLTPDDAASVGSVRSTATEKAHARGRAHRKSSSASTLTTPNAVATQEAADHVSISNVHDAQMSPPHRAPGLSTSSRPQLSKIVTSSTASIRSTTTSSTHKSLAPSHHSRTRAHGVRSIHGSTTPHHNHAGSSTLRIPGSSRPSSILSSATSETSTFCTAQSEIITPTSTGSGESAYGSRSRKLSSGSTVSTASVRTVGTSTRAPSHAHGLRERESSAQRQRVSSGASVTSVATRASVRRPPATDRDATRPNPASVVKRLPTTGPGTMTSRTMPPKGKPLGRTTSDQGTSKVSPRVDLKQLQDNERGDRAKGKDKENQVPADFQQRSPTIGVVVDVDGMDEQRGDRDPTQASVPAPPDTPFARRGSTDTITAKPALATFTLSPLQSLTSESLAPLSPPGASLDIGIPCIISSKRRRFRAFARYIGEVLGEQGPWVGVEVPVGAGDAWVGDSSDGRAWCDGTWGGIRYFDIGGCCSEWEFGGDSGTGRGRDGSKRRLDLAVDGLTKSGSSGGLKREGDHLSGGADRLKRLRSASPATSDMSTSESRGLFVRPQQVLYVVDAVGADL